MMKDQYGEFHVHVINGHMARHYVDGKRIETLPDLNGRGVIAFRSIQAYLDYILAMDNRAGRLRQ